MKKRGIAVAATFFARDVRADVAPDPVSVATSPVAGILVAVGIALLGWWYFRRRRGR